MTEDVRNSITFQRFSEYKRRLRDHNATPMICLGVGHDAFCGDLVCCTTEDLSLEHIRDFLISAAEMLNKEIQTRDATKARADA